MSPLTRKSGKFLRTAGGIVAAGWLAGVALTIGTVSQAVAGLRRYYLTQNTFDGSEALRACARGYHMASLWEIRETSHLLYNTGLGANRADSGAGPPSGLDGWVRTGHDSNNSTTAGKANCNAWTSTNGGGTVVQLENDWAGGTVVPISPWVPGTSTCNTGHRVWCVQNEGLF